MTIRVSVVEKIETGEPQTSSVVFGGEDLTDILVTSAGQWAKLTCKPIGYDYDAHDAELGGKVLLFNCGVKGRPESFANLK